MKKIALILAALALSFAAMGQNVTIKAVNRPASAVFRSIVEQTGKNFVYPTELLADMRISVDVSGKPLKHVLNEIFKNTEIEYKIKGRNIILKRRKKAWKTAKMPETSPKRIATAVAQPAEMLEEVVVVSRLEAPATETNEIGAKKLTAGEIKGTPVMFGESDVLKALQTQPGVSEGQEGLAGMHVHGGNADENLFMLDNVPLYQVNHFGGLFSAFNVDAIRYIDFFKSSIPAKYDGRLSSYLDVRTKNGSPEGHHGALRLGLTSGAFSIDGPIGRKTTYSVAVRRSWFDAITIPIMAILNSIADEKARFHYSFMDLNGKVTHRFNRRATGFVSVYFGNDLLKTGTKDVKEGDYGWYDDDRYDLHWGNLVAQTGLNYRLKSNLSAEFTAAYTRFFSNMKHDELSRDYDPGQTSESHVVTKTDNCINDWIFRGDFFWQPDDANRVRFGAGYTRHSFLPGRTSRHYSSNSTDVATRDSTWAYRANEATVYIEDDWRISERFGANAGFHASLFNISGKTHVGASPRISLSYRPDGNWAVKAAYARTTQYVHQLAQTYLSLPTDQWVPITGRFKPQTADKLSLGAYWQSPDGRFAASVEAYWKWMRNLVDYRDEYYLQPPMEMWNARLCSGSGTAKGIDFKVEKVSGKLTGHIAYSLAWADRTFADKNGGHTFPARFDNRHTINILLNWNISKKVSLGASWTGHSGNRFTLLPQVWESPDFDSSIWSDGNPLRAKINNYQLPFYHRLDLSLTIRRKRGYWNISLYNAYCHMNTIAISRGYKKIQDFTPGDTYVNDIPVFQKVKLLPIIPSVSYTWLF